MLNKTFHIYVRKITRFKQAHQKQSVHVFIKKKETVINIIFNINNEYIVKYLRIIHIIDINCREFMNNGNLRVDQMNYLSMTSSNMLILII